MVAVFLVSQSDARGLTRCKSDSSSLSTELSQETDAVTISPSTSVTSPLIVRYPGSGRGKYIDGLGVGSPAALSSFDVKIIPEFALLVVGSGEPDTGSGRE
jgi:hypothetical protein